MKFVTSLAIFKNWKGKTYDSILVIINRLINIVYYKPAKVIIDASGLAKVIIDIVIRDHSLHYPIISDCGLVFTFKF